MHAGLCANQAMDHQVLSYQYTNGQEYGSQSFLYAGASTNQATDHQHTMQVPEGLGWEPLDLTAEGTDIEDLLKQCRYFLSMFE